MFVLVGLVGDDWFRLAVAGSGWCLQPFSADPCKKNPKMGKAEDIVPPLLVCVSVVKDLDDQTASSAIV